MGEVELKPCPFCGGKARITTKKPLLPTRERDTLYVVSCSRRECMVRTRAWYPKSAAIAVWEQRASQDENKRLREGIEKWFNYVPKNKRGFDDLVFLQQGLGKLLRGER